jgi:hypothetical protein
VQHNGLQNVYKKDWELDETSLNYDFCDYFDEDDEDDGDDEFALRITKITKIK